MSLRTSASQPSQDFAKQLLVLIGTLVTSVAGFYFGAQTAASAARDKNATRTDQTTQKDGGANAGSGNPTSIDTPTTTTGPTSEADALKALGAVKLASGYALSTTPEAEQLGHDPTLASEASPKIKARAWCTDADSF